MTIATLRPTGAGDLTQLSPIGDTPNYLCVDEASADDDITYVRNTLAGVSQNQSDLYTIESLPGGVGVISGIQVYNRGRKTGGTCYLQVGIKTGGTVYESGILYLGTSYSDESYSWATNPQTGNAWAVDEINAMQIGTRLVNGGGGVVTTRCTQVYVIVTYASALGALVPAPQIYYF